MCKHKNKVYSTGIIDNIGGGTASEIVAVNVANLDINNDRTVTVEVFNWITLQAISIPVISITREFPIIGGPRVEIEENSAAIFLADLGDTLSFLFEVRITFKDTTEDVVANVIGLDGGLNRTLFIPHKELKHVELD